MSARNSRQDINPIDVPEDFGKTTTPDESAKTHEVVMYDDGTAMALLRYERQRAQSVSHDHQDPIETLKKVKTNGRSPLEALGSGENGATRKIDAGIVTPAAPRITLAPLLPQESMHPQRDTQYGTAPIEYTPERASNDNAQNIITRTPADTIPAPFTIPAGAQSTTNALIGTPPIRRTPQPDEDIALEVDYIFERMATSSGTISTVDVDRAPITIYLPPKRRTDHPVYEELWSAKIAHVTKAAQTLKQTIEQMVDTEATNISKGILREKKQWGVDTQLAQKLFANYKRTMLESILRAIQEAQPIPDEFCTVITNRRVANNGITAVQNTEIRYTGERCIDDAIEYSLLRAAYTLAGSDPAKVLKSWHEGQDIAIGKIHLPLGMIRGPGGDTHAIRMYEAMKDYVKDQKNHRYIRQRFEDLIFPGMMASQGPEQDQVVYTSFNITPFDEGEPQPESTDAMTLEKALESRVVPVVKIPIVETSRIASISPSGIYCTAVITALNGIPNKQLAQEAYFTLNHYLADAMHSFSERVWDALDR